MPAHENLQREILPIPDPTHVGVTLYDGKDPENKYPPIEPLRPPKEAPNMLIVLIDERSDRHEESLYFNDFARSLVGRL